MRAVCYKLAIGITILMVLLQIAIRTLIRKETPTENGYIAYGSAQNCDETAAQQIIAQCSPDIMIVEPYHDKGSSFSTPSWVRPVGWQSWSYDYRYLAYNDGYDINIYDTKTGESRDITHNLNKPFEINPIWSPTNYLLTFNTFTEFPNPKHYGLVVFDFTRNVGHEIAGDLSVDGDSWSPDGSQIVFSGSAGDNARPDLYSVKPDGTGLKQLTQTEFGDYGAHWSSDEKHIVFAGQYGLRTDLYMMDANGDHLTQLTFDNFSSSDSTWVLGDTSIFYETNRYQETTLRLLDLNTHVDFPLLKTKDSVIPNVSRNRDESVYLTGDYLAGGGKLCYIDFGDKESECFKIKAYPAMFPTWGG